MESEETSVLGVVKRSPETSGCYVCVYICQCFCFKLVSLLNTKHNVYVGLVFARLRCAAMRGKR